MDITINCEDCGQEFAWTAEEQAYYSKKGLEKPKHCMICRGKYEARKRDLERFKKSS